MYYVAEFVMFAAVLSLLLIIYFLVQIKRSESPYDPLRYLIVIIFMILVCVTCYLLFSPCGGFNTSTMSLWDYWTNDVLKLLAFAASDEVSSGLTLRRIFIWPCFIADIACIYVFIKLSKRCKN